MDRCLAVVEGLLRGQIGDDQIEELAEMVALCAEKSPKGRTALERFLEKLSAERRRRTRRFVIIGRRHLSATQITPRQDVVSAILDGVRLEPPRDARNALDFSERPAEARGTIVKGSAKNVLRKLPAPRMGDEMQSVYEMLAKTLSGTVAAFHMTQKGYWEINEWSSPRLYAAGGAVMFGASHATELAPEPTLTLSGRLFYSRSLGVIAHAAKTEGETWHWLAAHHGPVQVRFVREQVPGKPPKWIGHVRIAAATEWVEMEAFLADLRKPLKMEKEGVSVEVGPVKITEQANGRLWSVPLTVDGPWDMVPDKRRVSIFERIQVMSADGRRIPVGGHVSIGNTPRPGRIQFSLKKDSAPYTSVAADAPTDLVCNRRDAVGTLQHTGPQVVAVTHSSPFSCSSQ